MLSPLRYYGAVTSGEMSTKLKATISGHRSAFTKLLKKIEDGKSNEEFDRNELGTILDLILEKQTLFSFTNTEDSDCNNTFLNSHVTLDEQTKRIFRLIEHFLTRWKHEYLTSLREFHRVSGNNIQRVKLGDVVQIHDDTLPRTHWKIGVIEELSYGNDNLVRSAKIRTSESVMNRPIVKLYPLEIC